MLARATIVVVAVVLGAGTVASASELRGGSSIRTVDPSGVLATISDNGPVMDTANPFFKSLGTNDRACITCHVPDQAWSISPQPLQRRFAESRGLDPIFRLNDGATSPNADVSTVAARRQAYSMLLDKGLIRVGIGIPSNAEFQLVRVDDPYHYASGNELSLFRRPLPSTNLSFLNTVMWDGRETVQKLLPGNTDAENLAALRADLAKQANDATRGHAQASRDLTDAERTQIVDFELGLYTAQLRDHAAGDLRTLGAQGGPQHLSEQPFFVGINDLTVDDSTSPPTVKPPDKGMTLFLSWVGRATRAQEAVLRGEKIFDTRPITISGVAGLNDATGLPAMQGTCTTCHNTPNVGNHSVSAPLDIGIADASHRTPDQPLYTLRNVSTGEVRQTTDPGRALITGKWADLNKVKGPVLRGLAARAPYFHNGSAATLDAVVDFYNSRFNLRLSRQEHNDLVAFLRSL